jgi:hypothetical protein
MMSRARELPSATGGVVTTEERVEISNHPGQSAGKLQRVLEVPHTKVVSWLTSGTADRLRMTYMQKSEHPNPHDLTPLFYKSLQNSRGIYENYSVYSKRLSNSQIRTETRERESL